MSRTTTNEAFGRLVDVLLTACREEYGERLVSLAVFGSVGRGAAHPGSDLDFLLVADDLPRGRLRRMAQFSPVLADVEKWLAANWHDGRPPELSPILKAREEALAGSPLFLDMTEDARILFDRDGFLGGCLERLADRLRELGARRIVRGNAWWWDLKPDYKPGEVFSL